MFFGIDMVEQDVKVHRFLAPEGNLAASISHHPCNYATASFGCRPRVPSFQVCIAAQLSQSRWSTRGQLCSFDKPRWPNARMSARVGKRHFANRSGMTGLSQVLAFTIARICLNGKQLSGEPIEAFNVGYVGGASHRRNG